MKEWWESAKTVQVHKNRASLSESRELGGASPGAGHGQETGGRHCSQSTGRFSLCFFVNSSAFFMNFERALVYSSARSALSGCSG